MKNIIIIIILLILIPELFSEENFINPIGTYELESETTKDDEDIYGYYGEINIKIINNKQIIMTFFINKGAPSYNSGCGFGHAVKADGYFKRISSEVPILKDPLTDELLDSIKK